MTTLMLLLTLACNQMPSSGDPFGRVSIAGPEEVDVIDEINLNEEDNTSEKQGPMSFDEWAGDESADSESEPTDSNQNQAVSSDSKSTEKSTVAVVKPIASPLAVASGKTPVLPAGSSSSLLDAGWPLVVVKTLPELNPPRAILGLPNGEELVVKPGQVNEKHKLVVMSIGVQRVDIVRISQQGDRASLTSQSLPVQN